MICTRECRCLWRLEHEMRYHGNEATGGSELPNVSAGN